MRVVGFGLLVCLGPALNVGGLGLAYLCVLDQRSMLDGRRVCPNLKAADTNTFAEAGFTVLKTGKKLKLNILDQNRRHDECTLYSRNKN
jgi:hypothetical protein